LNKLLIKITAIIIGIIVIALLGFYGVKYIDNYFKEKVITNITVYMLGTSKDKKLILLTSKDQYQIEKTYSKKVLMLNFDAKVRVTVIADVNYYLDLNDQKNLFIKYDSLEKIYMIAISKPKALYPSIYTNTIKIDVLDATFGSTIVLQIKNKVEAMKKDISDEINKQVQNMGQNDTIEKGYIDSFNELVQAFIEKNHIKVKFETKFI
jgi:hypothetical protein